MLLDACAQQIWIHRWGNNLFLPSVYRFKVVGGQIKMSQLASLGNNWNSRMARNCETTTSCLEAEKYGHMSCVARNQEWVCWRGPSAIYPTDRRIAMKQFKLISERFITANQHSPLNRDEVRCQQQPRRPEEKVNRKYGRDELRRAQMILVISGCCVPGKHSVYWSRL
jgi:hypothetical protein